MRLFLVAIPLILSIGIDNTDASPAASVTWNEFLHAENIFPAQHATSPSLIGLANKGDAVNQDKILQELAALLARPDVFHKIYENYLTNFLELDHASASEYRIAGREAIFKKSLMEVAAHNLEYRAGRRTWYAGVTSMTHMTDDEFGQKYLIPATATRPSFPFTKEHQVKISSADVPTSLDYRESGIVTPVKDQSHCGVCYAFQAVAILESAYANNNGGTQLDLSEEDIRDCGALSKLGQCRGASGYVALKYIREHGGLPLEAEYPYQYNGDTHDCTSDGLTRYANVSTFKYLELEENEDLIVQTLIQYSIPIGVSVNASAWKKSYAGGPFYAPCDTKTNHAVTLVGYNEEVYFVKNSWGPKWGDKGYINLKRGDNNCCIVGHITYITQMA